MINCLGRSLFFQATLLRTRCNAQRESVHNRLCIAAAVTSSRGVDEMFLAFARSASSLFFLDDDELFEGHDRC